MEYPTESLYRQLRGEFIGSAVAEPDLFAADPAMVPEIEWQSRWFRGDFGRHFAGVDGESVEILEFGWWNRAAGPDFTEVVARVDGRILRGTLELDVDARDWEKHGHAVNPHYEEVILHCFLTRPEKRFFTRTRSHRNVCQVLLVPPTSGTAPRGEAPLRLGRCAAPLAAWPAARVRAVLLDASRLRADDKAKAFFQVAAVQGEEEAWFQACAAALGYHANRDAMRILAQRLPLRWLARHTGASEALLFGHAGFLDTQPFDGGDSADTARRYLRGLWDTWWKYRGEVVRSPRWELSGVRPANHPQRRVAGLAEVVRQRDAFFSALHAGENVVEAVDGFFSGIGHPFWDIHFTVSADRLPSAVALVGKERALDFLGNTVLPVLAWKSPALQGLLESLPARGTSRSVARAAERLLGNRPDAAEFLKSYACQQGLLQIYRDFCLRDTSSCAGCRFPELLAAWPFPACGAG